MPLIKNKKFNALKAQYGQKLAALSEIDKDSESLFDKIAELDPTANAKADNNRYLYLPWICARILKDPPRAQDLYKITEDLKLYAVLAEVDKRRSKRPGTILYNPYVKPHIDQYPTLISLSEALLPYANLKDRKKSAEILEDERRNAEQNSFFLYNGPAGKIVAPLTEKASQYWGKGTKWCISATKSQNYFYNYYAGDAPIIMFLPAGTDEKFAFAELDEGGTRNRLDIQIYNALTTEDYDISQTEKLAEFISTALQSPQFNREGIKGYDELRWGLQIFALRNPNIYTRILKQTNDEAIPDFLKLESIMSFFDEYEDEEWNEMKGRTTVGFALHPEIFRLMMSMGKVDEEFIARLEGLGIGKGVLSKVKKNNIGWLMIENIMKVPDPALPTPASYANDIKTKCDKFLNVMNLFDGEVKPDESDLEDYLKSIPHDFWQNEDLLLTALDSCQPFLDLKSTCFKISQMFQHPKAWLWLLENIDTSHASPFDHASQPHFNHVWTSVVNDIPFLQALVSARTSYGRDIIESIEDAKTFYDYLVHAQDIDWDPLVKKIESLYPNGLGKSESIEYLSAQMPKCDFEPLIKKSLSQRPELFSDIAPENQTVAMVVTTIRKDPESLADVAARFFTVKDSIPELSIAFNRMQKMNSPYLGMVAHHFISPGPG